MVRMSECRASGLGARGVLDGVALRGVFAGLLFLEEEEGVFLEAVDREAAFEGMFLGITVKLLEISKVENEVSGKGGGYLGVLKIVVRMKYV
jgi:hypothetical protein